MITLNIISIGGERKLIERLFPKIEKGNKEKREIRYNKESNSFITSFSKNKGYSFKWEALIYPELNNENKNEIKKELKDYFGKTEKEIKKNVIIFFGDNEIDMIIKIINNLEQTKRPLILFISKNKGKYSKFSDIRLVSFLQQDEDEEKTYNKIVSYLWEKDCYFNERGNVICKLSAANLFYKKPKGFSPLKILLIGLKRSGKSTLINIISKKLMAFELANDQSVTKTITEYEIFPFEEEGNNISCLKFYDSPGIEKTKELDSESIIIEFLEEKFNEINLIYFLKRDGAIEDCKKVFEKIVYLNNKRKDNKLPKIPIIFIINGVINVQEEKTSVAINTVKDYLKNNFGKDLYYEDNIKINDDEDSDNEEEKKKKYIDGNIIRVNLRHQKDEFSYQLIYGIDNLFKKSLEYLESTNPFKIDDLKKLKDKNKQLINFFKDDYNGIQYDKNKKDILIKESKNTIEKIMKENSLLISLPILKNFYEKKIYYFLILVGLFYSLFIVGVFFVIAGIYGLVKGFILHIALEYGFDEKDILDYGLEEYVFTETKEKNEKIIKKKIEDAKDFFEKLLKFTNGCQLVIKSFEVYKNTLESLKKLGKIDNDDWNKFHENII